MDRVRGEMRYGSRKYAEDLMDARDLKKAKNTAKEFISLADLVKHKLLKDSKKGR